MCSQFLIGTSDKLQMRPSVQNLVVITSLILDLNVKFALKKMPKNILVQINDGDRRDFTSIKTVTRSKVSFLFICR